MNQPETTTAEYEASLLTLTAEVAEAVKRSISHNERVAVSYDGSELDEADVSRVLFILDPDNDWGRENDGSLDVWGTLDGEAYRLNVFKF